MEKMKLLLVDDETRYLETTKKLIERKGYEVWTAPSGEKALQTMAAHNIHVVVLDVKMPGMDGNETLKQIKELYPLTEVIMLTGHATVDSAIDGLKSGAWDYLMKPADIEEIIEKAELAFQKRMNQEEKIRSAQAKQYLKSPREILKDGLE
ncbi:response regulator [Desulfobacter hydrogenophilus]|uniref:Response regulator n=1 Tax=Desulfobacter hydrogenophilus TaxID=2291 RepID=A0A328FHP0_9BACT|nr:response regulator [Desulfobacter hydrogenophilus]NDY72775.1 response regulator [Desulfobacter hydrogenophilus]QBH13005.1 response regulator [Desulfobacter hydrogenophilus]RAM03989.1 response regulator [Desulfobacter hydrogenophilus]